MQDNHKRHTVQMQRVSRILLLLVSESDNMAKSIGSRIEGRTSHGSMLSLDAISPGLAPSRAVGGSPQAKREYHKGKNYYASGLCTNVKPSLKNMTDKGERKRRKPST